MSRHEYDDEAYVVIERTSGSFGSLLVGIALGAAAALLLASRRGVGCGARRAR
jgi:hypothetical protein